jgi:hypothetical protein
MLYILLIIIAIGVLLASEGGKVLLGWLIKFALVAGGAYLGFWIVVIIWGLLSDKDTRETVTTIAGSVALLFAICFYLYSFYKKYKNGDFKREILKEKGKKLWLEQWNAGIGSKIAIVFVILAFSTMAVLLVYSFTINGFWQ